MSFLRDTNGLSELGKAGRGKADAGVVAWESSVRPLDTFVSVVSFQELEIGTLLMERRDPRQGGRLRSWVDSAKSAFERRVLAIDTPVALRCARLHVPNPASDRDAWIAATALVHGMIVVTRNVKDFAAAGAALLNPWRA